MNRPFALSLAAVLVMSMATACTIENPLFSLTSQGDEAMMGSTSTSTTGEPVTTTVQPNTSPDSGDEGSTYPNTSDSDTGTAEATSLTDPIGTTTSTTDPDPGSGSSTGQADTGDLPNPLVISASIATCVLKKSMSAAFAGPEGCEAIATVLNFGDGVMLIDTSVDQFPGGSRPAEVYLRFYIPSGVKDKTIASAVLSVRASSNPTKDGTPAGDLKEVAAFTDNDLEAEDMLPVSGNTLDSNTMETIAGQPSLWTIDSPAIIAGKDLHLGLFPNDENYVLFHSNNAGPEARPALTLTFE